ncbi:MAG TPA: hypothetical protein PKK99_03130 [Bacteroidia bacterium]|nr:hypothetical protein [Bacteroidia bacterium]HNP98016.1 hypothetical protein [Bacteroidia bacterium]
MFTNKNYRGKKIPGGSGMLFLFFSTLIATAVFLFTQYREVKIIPDNGQENLSSITDDKAISMVDQSDSSEINGDQIDVPELDEKNPQSLPDPSQSIHPSGIHPPLPSIRVSLQKWVVDANVGQLLTSAKHSLIQIPPRAFVDKDGKVVEGNVEINFREYHNFLDIFLSGIPMNYHNGDSAQLESAGMMELVASKDNVPLYVNPKNKINVMLASVKNSNDYNLYYFDRKKNEWVYKGKDAVVVNADENAVMKTKVNWADSVEQKFTYTRYNSSFQIYRVNSVQPKRSFFFGMKKEPGSFSFKLTNKAAQCNEERWMNRVNWVYIGDDASSMSSRLFSRDKSSKTNPNSSTQWNDFTVRYDEDSGSYLLSMYGENDSMQIHVLPMNRSDYSRKKFKEYFPSYAQVQEDRLQSHRKSFLKFQRDTSDYYASNGRYITTNYSASTAVMRQFTIDGFGIWNCDRPTGKPAGAKVVAHFEDQHGQPIQPESVFHVDKNLNTVFTYYPNTLNQFSYDPSSENLIWVVLKGNRIAAIHPKEFKQKYNKRSGICVFALDLNRDAVASKEDVAKSLKFDL